MDEVLKQLIETVLQANEKMIIVSGIVKEVRAEDCDISRAGQVDITKVRFKAVLNEVENYFKLTPKQGSAVLVAIIENNPAVGVLISCSEVEKIEIKLDEAEFRISDGKFTVKNAGADAKEILTTVLNKLKNAIITTPSGPGSFNPDAKAVFGAQKVKVEQLFH